MGDKTTALITGGAGFIGSHLADKLIRENFEVIVLDNLSTGKLGNMSNDVEFVEGCSTDRRLVQSLIDKIDVVFHLAAVASVQAGHENWLVSHQSNQGSTVNILDCITNTKRSNPQKFVFASSASVYGNTDKLPIDETTPKAPLSDYAVDKLASEYHAKIGASIHNIPSTILRLFNVYGARQDASSPYSGVISIFESKIRQKNRVSIYGTGEQTRDFVHVDDVVECFYRGYLSADTQSEVYNICTGIQTSIVELSHVIAEIYGVDAEVVYEKARVGDVMHSLGDNRKSVAKFNYAPQTSIRQGLEKTVKLL